MTQTAATLKTFFSGYCKSMGMC
uniref:Uncharacterized protein n=1 Tax=Anguilla anguilla TaxID=7936 RepID=A0A0E9T5U0_ANGAN